MYLTLAVLGLGSLVTACWILIMTMTPQAGRRLHDRLLQTVLNAPMAFFSTTDTGITANRFSQDLELIDMELPISLIKTAMNLFLLLAQLLVILASAKYVGIAMPFILVIVYFLQVYYLRTSRRLRLLDIETKAYLGTQFLEMLSGLITVRAFQWEYQPRYAQESPTTILPPVLCAALAQYDTRPGYWRYGCLTRDDRHQDQGYGRPRHDRPCSH
jgi:ATP-binding cassette subfamily C (CFTR/MRP) protein 1